MFAGFWKEVWTAALVNHLWQSTLVALLAWLLTLALKNNHARARYWVWMIASIKFLVPFSAFIAIGEWLRPVSAAPMQSTTFTFVAEKVAQPVQPITIDFSGASVAAASHPTHSVAAILLACWACGCLFVLLRWARGWRSARATLRASSHMALAAGLPVRVSSKLMEPGIFGIFRPVILLPESIMERLSPPQLQSILAHEMCHARRRDNLTIALHMLVETAFWFHPAVWWIEARLLEERERACDEAVLLAGNEAEVYAESILSVCKFYVEAPMACMSGVTGSDLKRRIVRIMTSQMARKLDLPRKLLLCTVALAAISAPVIFGLLHVTQVNAQTASEAADQGLAGTWQGTLHAGRDLRTVMKITKDTSGYKATLYSIDQAAVPIPATSVTLDGSTVKMSFVAVGGSYEGKLSPDGNTITGNFTQGSPLPLVLTRATPETAWTIPAPQPKIPPMDANASPSFEVATVKPSKEGEPGPRFMVRGRRFETRATTLTQILVFAYGVNPKQFIGLPSWADSDKFDIQGEPDAPGEPNDKQWRGMVQKLIAERFDLSFHRDKRVMPVYVLSVASGGSKMTPNTTNPNGLPGLGFRQLGRLMVTNSSMDTFAADVLQGIVLDRPVLNQTGLIGKYNFTLNWTPDDSQFGGMGARIPPPADGENAPPNLFTAIQEQIGLKLEAAKAPAEVLVIDHISQPSAN